MATDREQLYEALRRADAAGDTESAQRLAQHIGSLPQEAEYQVPRQQGEIEKAARVVGSKIVDTAKGVGQWARDAYMGPSDLPDLPEFAPGRDRPVNTSRPTRPELTPDFQANLGLSLTNNPAAEIDILKEQYPGIQFEPVASETSGGEYSIATWTDPQGVTHRGYVNAPGFSGRDAQALVMQTGMMVPAARFGQGASLLTGAARRDVPGLLGRVVRTGIGTGATRAALDKAVEPLGSKQGIDPVEVFTTGAAGAAAELAAPTITGAYRMIRGNPLRSGDGLSGQGMRLAREAGLDIDNMPPASAREFARVGQTGNIPAAGRAAELNEFSIRASRGQLTQSYPQLNMEERMRRGLEGVEAENIIKAFDKGQADDVASATGLVQGRLQPRPSGDLPEAQGRFLAGVREAEQRAGQRVDDAYTGLRARGDARIPVPAPAAFMARFTDALESAGRFADPDLTPATRVALRQLNERVGDAGGAVSLADFEKARRVIASAQRAAKSPEDAGNVRLLKRTLDDWLDETVDAGLMSGDPEIVTALKAARAARAEYGRMFEAKGPRDTAGKIVENIIEKAETPEMAMNYVIGQGQLAGQTNAVGAVRKLKDILGADSDAWNALREAAWNRIARDHTGQSRSPATFQKAWNEFNLRNRSLRDELFGAEEIALMNRYRQALGRTAAPPTNPSGTAFAAETAIRQVLRGLGQRERITGNVATGTMINFVSRLPINPFGAADWARRRAAAQAIAPLSGAARPLVAPVAGGTAVIDQASRN